MVEKGVVIEEAMHDDVEGIVAVHTTSLIETYTGITPELTDDAWRFHIQSDIFQTRCRESLCASIAHAEPSVLYVAREGGQVLGYSGAQIDNAGTNRMKGLYVARQGVGIGTALFRRAIDWHAPDKDIYLTVVPGTRAEGFQKGFGFEETGFTSEVVLRGGQRLPLKEMKLPAGQRRY